MGGKADIDHLALVGQGLSDIGRDKPPVVVDIIDLPDNIVAQAQIIDT